MKIYQKVHLMTSSKNNSMYDSDYDSQDEDDKNELE